MRKWKKQEETALNELHNQLDSEIRKVPQFPEVVNDRRLLRFYYGNGKNVDKAVIAYRKFLKWRKDNNVDMIRQDIVYGKASTPFKFPNGEKIINLAPQIVMTANAVDKENQPIILEKYDFSPKKFIENVSLDDYILFLIYCLEYRNLILEQLSYQYEQQNINKQKQSSGSSINNTSNVSSINDTDEKPYGVIMRFCNLRDLKGISLGHLGQDGRNIVSSALKIGLPNYPDMLGVAYHVNVPWIFKASWNIIKAFLDEDIISKIHFISSDYLSFLEKHITIDNIPVSIGGKFPLYNEKFEFDRSKNGPLYYEGAPTVENMLSDDHFEFLPSPISPITNITNTSSTKVDKNINLTPRTSSLPTEDSKEEDQSWGYVLPPDRNIDGLPISNNTSSLSTTTSTIMTNTTNVTQNQERSVMIINSSNPITVPFPEKDATMTLIATIIIVLITMMIVLFDAPVR